jgi:O-antigen ligase
MKVRADDKYLGSYVLLTTFAVCLFVAPFNSVDATNLPKLCLLIILSFIAVGFAFSQIEFFKAKENRPVLLVFGFFLLHLVIVFLVDDRDFARKLYGTHGRNTGFAAYLSLTFLLIASTVSASKILLKRYLIALICCGSILSIYGIAQSTDRDFYQFYLGIGTKVFGSFGNSNFHSGFMGIVAAVVASLIFFSSVKLFYRAVLVIVLFMAIYNISLSSEQGYLNFIFGFASTAVVYFFKTQKAIIGWIILIGSSICGFLLMLGILDRGPFAESIFKSSLQARTYYWRAAFDMILNHPVFGVGMDGYGDLYRRARPSDYISTGFVAVSDSAHNVSLDIGAGGGLPLFLAYLAINLLTLIALVRTLKRSLGFDIIFTTIVAAWVAYQAQALISINQLGLGVWGWSLSGLIIGYELNSRPEISTVSPKGDSSKKTSISKISGLAVVIVFFASGIGIAIAVPPYVAAGKFYKALQSADAEIIQPAAYLKPYDRDRFLYVAQILAQNKLEQRAIIVLRDASKIYPDSYEIWSLWAGLTPATALEVAHAKAEMKRLDPLNPDPK